MTAYYNEIDSFAAAWLRELIARNLIAPGDVDERSIEVVQPQDLAGYTQCHFFAGIGVWSYALRRAGWDDARPVWTGSCPCQPFSPAGKGEGFDDPRHLWPHLYRLIRECGPDVCFGEQVASQSGLAWLDLVSADLEGSGYAVGAATFPAAGVGAPHQRHRLYWLADAASKRRVGRWTGEAGDQPGTIERPERLRATGGLVDAECERGRRGESRREDAGDAGLSGEAGELGNPESGGLGERGNASLARSGGHADGSNVAGGMADANGGNASPEREQCGGEQRLVARDGGPGPVNGFWRDADWIPCTDGKARPVEPRTFPLAHGAPARVGRLRGYGNAINAEQAVAFIEAYLDIQGGCVA